MIPPSALKLRRESADGAARHSLCFASARMRCSKVMETAHPNPPAASGIFVRTPSHSRRPRNPLARPPFFYVRARLRNTATGCHSGFPPPANRAIIPSGLSCYGEEKWQDLSSSLHSSLSSACWPPARKTPTSRMPESVRPPVPASLPSPAPASSPARLSARRPVLFPTNSDKAIKTARTKLVRNLPGHRPAWNMKAIGARCSGGFSSAQDRWTGRFGGARDIPERDGECSGNC